MKSPRIYNNNKNNNNNNKYNYNNIDGNSNKNKNKKNNNKHFPVIIVHTLSSFGVYTLAKHFEIF